MDFISASGTASAAPIKGWAISALALIGLAAAAAPKAELDVEIRQLRNAKGAVHLCLTHERGHFLNCSGDPSGIKQSAAAGAGAIRLSGLAPGRYALSLIHDENGNGRLDTVASIPKEGFGFSRNPAIRFGPPRFSSVQFDLAAGSARQTVRVRYLL